MFNRLTDPREARCFQKIRNPSCRRGEKMEVDDENGWEDLVEMVELTEDSILENLRVRYNHDRIYVGVCFVGF
jgi:myosin heavy subunit